MDDNLTPSSLSGFTTSGCSKRSRAFELLREANYILRKMTSENRSHLAVVLARFARVLLSHAGTNDSSRLHQAPQARRQNYHPALAPSTHQAPQAPQLRKPLLPSWRVLPPKSAILTPGQIPANKPRWNRRVTTALGFQRRIRRDSAPCQTRTLPLPSKRGAKKAQPHHLR
ncbi:hypothetical protein MTO96_030360 [Rhipicephalus appendiculatus]